MRTKPSTAGAITAPQSHGAEAGHDFRQLIDHATDMLCRLSPEGEFLYVSPASQRLLGYGPEELVGRNKVELIHPEDHALVQRSSSDETAGGDDPSARHGVQLCEYRLRRKDEKYIWVQTSALIIRDADGRATQVIASVRDVTERKQAQDNLRHSERLASLGTLAAGIAHEINNPLGAILMAAHAAREFHRQGGQEPLVEQMIEQIMADTRRASQIVRSVLQFARQEPADKRAVRLRDLVLSARMHVLRQLRRDAVEVKVRGPDESPWVHVGVVEIEQTLVNLLQNAIDAGADRIEVQVRPLSDGRRVSVQIIDNGKGMSREQITHAFDPFYTGRSHVGGTGLGLSIAQGIIVAHGGKIAITSAVSRGTTVTFDLPRCEAPGPQEEDAHA